MKESEAKNKFCPMMSNKKNIVMCQGSKCGVWESWEHEESRSTSIDNMVDEGYYQPAKILMNHKYLSYRMVYIGEGGCGLITKELNNG